MTSRPVFMSSSLHTPVHSASTPHSNTQASASFIFLQNGQPGSGKVREQHEVLGFHYGKPWRNIWPIQYFKMFWLQMLAVETKRITQNCLYLNTHTHTHTHTLKPSQILNVVVVQSPSCVQLLVMSWTVARQAPLSSTLSWSLLKFTDLNQWMNISSFHPLPLFCVCLHSFPHRHLFQ